MRIRHFTDPDQDSAQLKKNPYPDLAPDQTPDPTLNRNEEKNIFILKVGRHKIRSYKLSF